MSCGLSFSRHSASLVTTWQFVNTGTIAVRQPYRSINQAAIGRKIN
jgi:hypothetical protein